MSWTARSCSWAWVTTAQSEGPVGHAVARLARSRDTVSIALERLRRPPLVFLHPPTAGCGECDAARASID